MGTATCNAPEPNLTRYPTLSLNIGLRRASPVTSWTIAAYRFASRSFRSFARRSCTAALRTRSGGDGRDSSEPLHSWCSHGPASPALPLCSLRVKRSCRAQSTSLTSSMFAADCMQCSHRMRCAQEQLLLTQV